MRLTFRNAHSSFPVPVRLFGAGYAGGHVPELSLVTVCAQPLLLVCDTNLTGIYAGMLGGVPVLFFGAALASVPVPVRFFRVCFKARYAPVVLGEFRTLPHALPGGLVPERSTRIRLDTSLAGPSVFSRGNIVWTVLHTLARVRVPEWSFSSCCCITTCADVRPEHGRVDPRRSLCLAGRRAHLTLSVPVRNLRGTRDAGLCFIIPERKGVAVRLVAREALSCFLVD